MRPTPLVDDHQERGARLVDFHGWQLPLQFDGILAEHRRTRTHVSLFDCSHMGEICVQGGPALARYSELVISDVSAIPVGRGRYGALLSEAGGVVDDLITTRLADDEVWVVCNAAPKDEVLATLRSVCGEGVDDLSEALAKIDVQGPEARATLQAAGFGDQSAALSVFGACREVWRGWDVVVTRMGYTGELGYELYITNAGAVDLWRALLAFPGAAPAGLGARDTLRLEMGYPLSGQDIGPDCTALECGLERFVAWETPFRGKAALEAQRAEGVRRKLTGIRTRDRRAPRPDYAIYNGDSVVGRVTSGAPGPKVGHGIGLAMLDVAVADPGSRLEAGPKRIAIETSTTPFYNEGSWKR